MNQLGGGPDVQTRPKRFLTRKRALSFAGVLGLAAVVGLPRVEDAAERSYIKRCVEHRADTCGSDREEARTFCTGNPTAYDDNPAPVEHSSTQQSAYMNEAEKATDRCETAYLYHHRNDGLFGGLIGF